MGDSTSNPDWVELYNTSNEKINIEGWVIRDSTDSNKIDLNGNICPKSFRKFDFSNKLNKDGDKIRLLDSAGATNSVNEINYFSDQIPSHVEGQSTGRQPDGSDTWSMFTSPTPTNDESCSTPGTEPTPTPTPTPTSSTTATPTPTPTPTPKVTPKPSASPKSSSPSASPQVLAEKDRPLIASDAGLLDTSSEPHETFQNAPSKKVAGILIVSGTALVLFALGFHLWYRKINKGKIHETKDPFEL